VSLIVACALGLLAAAPSRSAEEPRTIGAIERIAPEFDALVPPGAQIEVLADGFEWSEGPVWSVELGGLLFSDIPRNRVLLWREGEGVRTYLEPAGYTGAARRGGETGSNGLALDGEGRLLLCQHGDRCVSRMDAPLSAPQSKFVRLAERHDGKRFNSPNDLAVHSSGAIYFTDPPYGLERQFDDPAREAEFCGVYRVAPDGRTSLLYRDLSRPNGIAFSPDEKTLYVANSDGKRAIWLAFDVQPDGSVANERVFFDATAWMGRAPGAPDGLKVDSQGNLFATGPGGVLVFSADGKHLGTISPGEATANCAFDADGKHLYMTSDMYLCRVKLR
jgi:gluconolactonase